MSKEFPCPNPACTQLFPPEALAGVSALACPKCGAVFQLRPGVAGNAPRQAVMAPRATVEIPRARPVASRAAPQATASPEEGGPGASLFMLDPHGPALRKSRLSMNAWLKGAMLVLLLVVAAACVMGTWKLFSKVEREEASNLGDTIQAPQVNCQIIMPSAAWQEDGSGIKGRLKAVLVMRRAQPHAWVALLVKDYKDQRADDAEVRNEALRRLANYFNKENLESERVEDGTLAHLPAQRLVFRGEVDKTSMSGECYSVANRGLNYWLITWATTSAARPLVTEEFNDLRKRFSFLKNDGEAGKE